MQEKVVDTEIYEDAASNAIIEDFCAEMKEVILVNFADNIEIMGNDIRNSDKQY